MKLRGFVLRRLRTGASQLLPLRWEKIEADDRIASPRRLAFRLRILWDYSRWGVISSPLQFMLSLFESWRIVLEVRWEWAIG